MTIERILGTDTGKVAFEKADRNFVAHETKINNLDAKVIWKQADYKLESDKPSAYPEQQTTIFLATKAWNSVTYLIVKTEKYDNNIAIQYLPLIGCYRLSIPTTDTWTAWQKNLTDKQPDWITATLQNGWTGDLKYRINQIGQLEICGIIIPGTRTFATTIATLVIPILTSNAALTAYSDIGDAVNGITLLGDVHEIRVYTPYAGTSANGRLHIRSVIPT